MTVKTMILLYQLSEEKKAPLEAICSMLRIPFQYVDRPDYLQPLGALTGQTGFSRTADIYSGDELPEEMMLMAGLSSEQIDTLLAMFRANNIKKINLKAMLTPTNANWNSIQLFMELKREHAAMNP